MNTVTQISANLIINYIAPACERLSIEPKQFIRPETIAAISQAIHDKKYTMSEWKQFIRDKEEDYQKDLQTFNNPYIIDNFEILKLRDMV